MTDWTAFELADRPPMSARRPVESPPPGLIQMIEACMGTLAQPVAGITTDGTVRPGLYTLGAAGASTAPVLDAALGLLAHLDADQRQRLVFPLEADERRTWFNIHPNVFRHGLLLEDLDQPQRQAAMAVMEASLSSRGFRQAHDIMLLNGLLIELTGKSEDFGEWPYFFSLFGMPSPDEPWAWQIDGHHLNLNCLVLGQQLVLTPSFMGSEPCWAHDGPLAGTVVFEPEERAGLNLIRSLDSAQQAKAVLYPSIAPGDLPPELSHPIDGRMRAGAFKDNATIAYAGLRGDEMSEAQRRLLRDVVGTYVGWTRDPHAAIHMSEVEAHLDETYFAWMGSQRDDGPFYYRLQSPVVLIELDHHPGIVFANTVPSRNHVHSILRAPNGGDYGVDLLRQHYERFDHSNGQHRHR